MSNVDKIRSSFPLLFDGAMGTYYIEKSEKPLPECEMANIFDRDKILDIHKEYLRAGAAALKTNTFGANRRSLRCTREILDTIIEQGYKIALEAVDNVKKENNDSSEKFIFADIGPVPYDSSDDDSFSTLVEEYVAIVDKFLNLGAKNFIFETFDEGRALHEVSEYIKNKCDDSYIIVSFAINPDGYTRKGYSGEKLLEDFALDKNVDSVGFNCISGPGYILRTVDKIKIPNKTISIMPNASYPTVVNNRIFYSDNANYFANTMLDFLDRGVEIIGGCCGTTPSHIEKLSNNLKKHRIQSLKDEKPQVFKVRTKPYSNVFYDKLCGGKKVIAVELDPPADVDIEKYMNSLKRLKELDVDAVTIADCPVGRARIDSSLMAYKIKNEVGLEPVVHLTCRDRNLNATKALLLGLNIENIRNLIVVTGDPIPTAEKDEIKPVFNFNSRLLAKYIGELNENVFSNKMVISSGLNINAKNFLAELNKARKKVENGVEVFYTQPVLSENAIENIKIAKKELKAKIMGGIIPIVSHRNAVFMNEEISGINVDEKIIAAYENLTREEAAELAVSMSLEFIEQIEEYVDGLYLITPFNRVEIIRDIVNKYRNKK